MEAAAGIYSRIMFPDVASIADPRLSEMQKSMLDATPDCIKVLSVDGNLVMMNRAGCLALNVPEDSEFGMPWLSLLPEEVHHVGMEALRTAAAGQAARFPGKSLSPERTIYWDNLLTPLIAPSGEVLSILCVSRDVTQKTLLERQLQEAVDREHLLAREMRHRVKNLFSVASGLIAISKREADSIGAAEAAMEILGDKLYALSRAYDAVFAQEEANGDDAAFVEIRAIVTSVLQPYGEACAVTGSRASIRRADISTFALFLHELATNSVKYGAFSTNDGNVSIQWVSTENALDLTWSETGGPQIPASPNRRGFGTEMVDRIVRSAGGMIQRTWRAEGLVVDLHFPSVVHKAG